MVGMRRLSASLIAVAICACICHSQVISKFGPLGGNNQWTGTNQYTLGITIGPITFSQLSSIGTQTTIIYISDAQSGSSPCAGGGTGSLAVYENGAWTCSFGGGGGGGGVNPGATANQAVYTASGSVVSGQPKPVIDARDWLKCDGVTNDTAAF